MKSYVKPELYFESFELSQHIAACALDMPHSRDVNVCWAEFDSGYGYPDGVRVFMSQSIGCQITDFEDYCYTNGSSGIGIFNS